MLGAWLCTTVLATTIEVGSGPETISEAIDQAEPGDEIVVPGGAWDERLVIDKALTLTGVDRPVLMADNGNHDLIVVDVAGGPVIVRGFTIDRLSNFPPSVVVNGAELLLDDIVFVGSENRLGSDLIVDGSDLTVRSSSFVVANLPRLDFSGHVKVTDSTALFEDVVFANGTGDVGGALFLGNTDGTIRRCTFTGNTSGDGGALAVVPGLTTTIEDSVFEGNEAMIAPNAEGLGGAIRQEDGALLIARTTFRFNNAVGAGAVRHENGPFQLVDSVVESNEADEVSGVSVVSAPVATILRTNLVGNVSDQGAQGEQTGALAIRGSTTGVDVAGNLFCGNSTRASGAALYIDVDGGDPLGPVHNNRFVANVAESGAAAIRVAGAEVEIAQNTFVDSLSGQYGAVTLEASGAVVLVNNAIVDSVGAAVHRKENGSLDADYNLYDGNDDDVDNADPGEHDVLLPPGFVGHLAGDCGSDLRPAVGSPLVDAGDPGRLDDDGSRSDIGAYGGAGASTLLDVDGDGVIIGDCDPFDAGVGPDATEIAADGIDQDCDGLEPCFVDGDGDGTGSVGMLDGPVGCEWPGVAATSGDCDDTDASLLMDCSTSPDGAPKAGEEGGETLPPSWFCSTGGGSGGRAIGWIGLGLLIVVRRRTTVES